jgi:hypothetical protein
MAEIACAHPSCRCTLSSSSPDPYCCDYCAQHQKHKHHCECGHEACGGVAGIATPEPARVEPELDPSLGRKA